MNKRTACLLLALVPLSGVAQTPTAEFALIDYHVGKEIREYHYVLRNRGLSAFDLADVYIDISAPRGERLPPLLEMSGEFLMDAFQVRRDITDLGRPDLGIATPAPWSSAIYINGTVSWGAPRFFSTAEGTVGKHESLGGFILRSSAVPALRRWDIDPFYTPSMQQGHQRSGMPGPQWNGWTVGPGWPAELVDVSFVKAQYRQACSLSIMRRSACERADEVIPALILAEREGRDRRYRVGLDLLREIAEGETLSPAIRDVLLVSVAAARDRPPSKR